MESNTPIQQQEAIEEQLNCITLGLRVTTANDTRLHDWYITHFKKWLDYRGYHILATSFGIHVNAEHPHFHYHLIVTGKLLSNPLASLKRDFDIGKITHEYNTYQDTLVLPKYFTSEKYKGRINISLQMKHHINIGTDIFNFLQYPFKEGVTNSKYNYNLDEYGGQSQLQEKAIAIYQSAKRELEKKKKKEDKDLGEWEKLVKYLDEFHPDRLEQVQRFCLTYYKSLTKKPPSIRYMIDQAERYSFYRGIIDFDSIIANFRRF